jgi:putative CocE/NonD family hydrolase
MERMLQKALNELPIGGIDERVIGKPVPYFRKWILPENAHTNATFWRSVAHGTKMQSVRAAAHIIGGWYDIFLAQALRDYAALREAGRSPYLTIGNWRHVDIDCAWETLRSSIDWYDAHLKGQSDRLREKPVRIFLMGANRWLEYDSWPPPAEPIRLYLQEQGQLGADAPPENCAPDHYRYDPAHPTPALGGPMYQPGAGVVDNRPLEARRDVISFSTPPLESDVDVIGHVFLELYAQTSALSADFFARLCDVYPDGRSINLCDGGTRVNVKSTELQPDGSFRILIELWATANRFKRGHRIRLLIMSGQHPRFARNLGTDEPIAAATRMIVADQTIYHDAAHPSALIIPIAGDVE